MGKPLREGEGEVQGVGEALAEALRLSALAVEVGESMPCSEGLGLGEGLGDRLALTVEDYESAAEADSRALALTEVEGVTSSLLAVGCRESLG